MPIQRVVKNDRIELETGPEPQASIVWLHGLGADGNDFVPIVPELDLGVPARFVFPHAPMRGVTINMGLMMRAWYDVRDLSLDRDEDERGIDESAALIEELLAGEKARGVPSTRIVLAGFSQGGAMTYHVGLRHAEPLAGLLVLSAYLLLPDRLEAEAAAVNRAVPIFHGHGSHDPLVPPALGRSAVERLRPLGYPAELRTYPMEHSVHPEEIRDVAGWLRKCLAAAPQ